MIFSCPKIFLAGRNDRPVFGHNYQVEWYCSITLPIAYFSKLNPIVLVP